MGKVISAGHICLDITPVFPAGKNYDQIGDLLIPGKLIQMDAASVHTGGSVANTGLALKLLGNDVTLLGKVGNDAFGGMVRNILSDYGAISQVPDVDGVGALCASPANRLLTAVRLQKLLNVPILVSGGQVYSDSGAEAEISARILKSLGVPDDKILTETKSVNTTQNARYCAKILRDNDFKKPLLVTSAFHMNRAMLNFSLCRFKPTAYPTDFTVTHNPTFHYTKLRPQAEALLLNVTVMQELLRTCVTEVFGI